MIQAASAARPGTPPAPSLTPAPRRPPLSRVGSAHALMVASALLAFVLVAALAGHRGDTVRVAVARSDIAPGGAVSPAQLRWVTLPAGSALATRLVGPAQAAATGWMATRAVSAGQPLVRADLARPSGDDGLRWIAIPVPKEHAAGGAVVAGDRVDVIDVVDAKAAYVVAGVEVVKVNGAGSGTGLAAGSERDFSVVVRADADQALAIAAALADGKLEVVRSSGATPVVPEAASVGAGTPAPPTAVGP